MMIEVFVSARTQGEIGLKKRGDILAAKLSGSQWGADEKGAVVQWTDASLEAELRALKGGGEAHPVIIHPYEENELLNDSIHQVNRSKIHVDLDSISSADRLRLESRTTIDKPLAEETLVTLLRTKVTKGGVDQPTRTPPRTRTR